MAATTLKAAQLFDLSGFVACVTGGGTGIGLMMACGLASNGARVYITGRRKEVLEQAAQSISDATGSLIPIVADVTDKKSILDLVQEIESKEGKLHVLINNAGQVGPCAAFLGIPSAPECRDTATFGRALFDSQGVDEWANLYAVNVASFFFVSTAFLGLLEKATKETPGYTSVIINITSICGIMKNAQKHFAYNASKAAGTHMTKMLSTELALREIPVRVNSIAPGPFPSEMTEHQGKTISGKAASMIARGIHKVPADRGGIEEEIAATALYLASRAGCYMNGQELVVDGGTTAVNPSTI